MNSYNLITSLELYLEKNRKKSKVVKILHTVYIVHQFSGVCLISESFSENELDFDSDLISGYVVAFKSIGKEMSKGSGDLKIIK